MKYDSPYSNLYLKNSQAGGKYDEKIRNRFESFIFDLEKVFLLKIIKQLKNQNKTYLDFACGTGRIISFVVKNFQFEECVGFDSSTSMMIEAKKKIAQKGIQFIVGNIVEDNTLLKDDHFDVVTVFRLILNLEPKNRLILLSALSRKIRKGGIIIINNHMNRYSILGIMALFAHKIFKMPLKNDIYQQGNKKRTIINTMSEKEARILFENSGFRIIKTYRFILFPGHKNFVVLPRRILFVIELFFSRIPLLNLLCKDQIYVCEPIK